VADCTAASLLLERMPEVPILNGDKGYDSNAIRRKIEENGTMPNIPPKSNRRWKNCFSPVVINQYSVEHSLITVYCLLDLRQTKCTAQSCQLFLF
jgi:hypothetical protein